MKAVVLLSGGVDSATALFYARRRGYDCRCLVFDYGQRHRREVASAKRIAKAAGCGARVLKIDLPWKGSSLLDRGLKLPRRGNATTPGRKGEIPSTYVPGRNGIFLSYAVSYAEAIGAGAVFIGANAIDFSGYPDCRPEYYGIFNRLVKRGTKAGARGRGIKIIAPLINMRKAEIIKLGMRLKVPFQETWSCYGGGRRPCLKCDSCAFRAKGFREAGFSDPLVER